jgi:hypothetical protein
MAARNCSANDPSARPHTPAIPHIVDIDLLPIDADQSRLACQRPLIC